MKPRRRSKNSAPATTSTGRSVTARTSCAKGPPSRTSAAVSPRKSARADIVSRTARSSARWAAYRAKKRWADTLTPPSSETKTTTRVLIRAHTP